MLSIFYAEYEKERLEQEKRIKARQRAHEEELMRLNITEEEFQEQEREKKIQEEIQRKKERRKEGVIIASCLAVIVVVYILIAAATKNTVMAGIFGLVVGMLILIYVPFILGWMVEKILKRNIEFNGWLVFLSVIFSGVLGFFTATGSYSALTHEYGDESVVYITPDGYCYHQDKDCFEIKGHVVKARNYGSVKKNKRPCEICCK